MSFLDFQNRPVIFKNVTIENPTMTDAEIQQKQKDPSKVPFIILAFAFITGALTFATALAYSNFMDSIIKKYSFGPGILERFFNLVLITIATFIFLYIVWKIYPQGVSKVIQ